MKKRYYFVRHGQTDYNRRRIVQGSGVDSDLNDRGREQAAALYEHYGEYDYEAIYCSELKRTYQTISAFDSGEVPLIKDARINEISWGVHEGKTGTLEMKQAYDRMTAGWKNGNYDARLEDAESAQELHDRCVSFLDDLVNTSYTTVLICTHGRTMRCLACLLSGLPISEMERYAFGNTAVTIADYEDGQWSVVLTNDLAHLENL